MHIKKIGVLLLLGVMFFCSCGKKEQVERKNTTAVVENNNGTFLISENEDMVRNPNVESARAEGEMITVIVPNEDSTSFIEMKAQSVSSERIDAIISCMKQNNVFPAEIKVPSIDVKNGKATADFGKEFGNYIKTVGSTGEYYIMGSIVNSIIKNYGVEKVKITCNGKSIKTGHDIYDEYMEEYQ